MLKKNIFREAWNNLLKPLSKSKLGFHELALPKLSISVKRNFAHFSVPCFSQKIVAAFIIFGFLVHCQRQSGPRLWMLERTKHLLHLLQAQKSRQQLWQHLHAVDSRALALFFFSASSAKSIFLTGESLPASYYVTCPRSPQSVPNQFRLSAFAQISEYFHSYLAAGLIGKIFWLKYSMIQQKWNKVIGLCDPERFLKSISLRVLCRSHAMGYLCFIPFFNDA